MAKKRGKLPSKRITQEVSWEALEEVRKMVKIRGGMAALIEGLKHELNGRTFHRQQVWNWLKDKKTSEPSLGIGILMMKIAHDRLTRIPND